MPVVQRIIPKRIIAKRIIALSGLICVTHSALASSPAAWGELNRKASVACLKAVDLAEAKVHGAPIDFDEIVLLIVEGRHTQAHMNNATTTKYCLYAKSTARTNVSEMPNGVATAKVPAPATGRTCWSETVSASLKWPRRLGSTCTARNETGDAIAGVVRK